MLNFCTIFDNKYLAKGICLYRSLESVCNNFHLYIFALDDVAFQILEKLSFLHASIISLNDLEGFYPDLLNVKSGRGRGEFSWTCKGPALQYCFEKKKLGNCTYLDADLCFYSDPQVLFNENTECDVMLTEHGYSKEYDLSETNGRYCGQFIYFRNSENGFKILKWWTGLCIDWCFSRHEPGRFGDQKYLEKIPDQFANVHIIRHMGIVGPWGIQSFRLKKSHGRTIVLKKNTKEENDLVCYHFHFLQNQNFGKYNEFLLGPYKLSNSVKKCLYFPYLNCLKENDFIIRKIDHSNDALGSVFNDSYSLIQFMFHFLKNCWKPNKILWRRKL